ncbi:hypothetical protein [Paenibacillus radicis (ex Gao et al. 2016)]|uniref:Uncharacterized protein n=1 Tax=Paenibacillus radicis (ex Gao et al. 2016) TaxID=1737354 RepID=A0A917H0U8_9BACL|nr:hypothetical protein [Paenibacillus radicis (ex Gao et al. 2016)]GGG63936.1 hypothetical protein GCM10010918_17470 [Paenibacillus radicis (ex Gao et al. 2016)]
MDFLNFSSYDWHTWSTFLKEHWLLLAVALVVLLLIVRIVKTVVKWALVAVIVVGIVIYSGYSMDDLKAIGTKVADSVKQEAVTAMVGEVEKATFTTNSDGSFTVKTDNLILTGEPGSGEVTVSFRNTPLGTWKIDNTVQTLIDQAKQNSKA